MSNVLVNPIAIGPLSYNMVLILVFLVYLILILYYIISSFLIFNLVSYLVPYLSIPNLILLGNINKSLFNLSPISF